MDLLRLAQYGPSANEDIIGESASQTISPLIERSRCTGYIGD